MQVIIKVGGYSKTITFTYDSTNNAWKTSDSDVTARVTKNNITYIKTKDANNIGIYISEC